jgi:hypothetical protein
VERTEVLKLKRKVLEWWAEGRRRKGRPKKIDAVGQRMNYQGLPEKETRDRFICRTFWV